MGYLIKIRNRLSAGRNLNILFPPGLPSSGPLYPSSHFHQLSMGEYNDFHPLTISCFSSVCDCSLLFGKSKEWNVEQGVQA